MKSLPIVAWLLLSVPMAIADLSSGVVETKDIPYVVNGQPRQTLDLYLPAGPHGRPLPLVVWIHGGAWKLGSKDWITVGYLAEHGIALASVGYRFSQEAVFPAQIEDCNAALDFLRKNASHYGLDPARIIVGGGSAGGHLALLLGLAREEKAFGADPSFRPLAILDFFGPTNLATARDGISKPETRADIDGILHQLLGAAPADRPDLARAASPLTYVTKAAPPVLIIHGAQDDMVPLDQSRTLQTALNQANVKNDLMVVPGAGHDGPLFQNPDVREKVLAFVESVLAAHDHP